MVLLVCVTTMVNTGIWMVLVVGADVTELNRIENEYILVNLLEETHCFL